MKLSTKKGKSNYEKHLEHMKDGYSTQFREEVYRRCNSPGPLERKWGVTEVDNIHDLEELNLERLESSVAPFSSVRGENGLELPAFFTVKNCEWYSHKNSDVGGPILLAIIESANKYETPSTPLRRKLVREISDNVDGVLYPERKITLSNLKDVEKETDGDYIAIPFKISCEESLGGYLMMDEGDSKTIKKEVLENRKKVLPYNLAGITGLIDAAEKYTGITGSYVFQKEEQRLKRLPNYIAELFVKVDDTDAVAAILENFSLGTNITIKV